MTGQRLVVVLVIALAAAAGGCTRLGAQSRLVGKWQGVQEPSNDPATPVRMFDPTLTFEMEFKSDHTLRANLPNVGVVYGTWRVLAERRNALDLTLGYSNDGKAKFVDPMSIQFVNESQFVGQPPGAPDAVRFSRVK